ncbi:unnamed protein product [Brassica napus]|uniref:(rape) hypothetical protein n=1 Tax=Brassica napus TaxID=3708 RepID=A0A817A1Z5_BRANA|nr:unnamed protein product [Brassica napus]
MFRIGDFCCVSKLKIKAVLHGCSLFFDFLGSVLNKTLLFRKLFHIPFCLALGYLLLLRYALTPFMGINLHPPLRWGQ